MGKKDKFNPKDWQGRRQDQVEANNWMLVVAVTIIGILAISAIIISAIV
jgi:hypothetical protein